MSSSSNQSLNQQLQQAPQPPPHQNGPIYVSSSAQGIPSSASSNSVVYASQQQTQVQPIQQQNVVASQYGQTNGPTATNSETTQYGQIPMAPPMLSGPGNSVPIPPAGPIGRAVSSAPQAPPPPPLFGGPNFVGTPPQPAPPAQPPAPPSVGVGAGAGAPPPPPPPPMGGLGMKKEESGTMDMSSLAAQLQNARLKRNNKVSDYSIRV